MFYIHKFVINVIKFIKFLSLLGFVAIIGLAFPTLKTFFPVQRTLPLSTFTAGFLNVYIFDLFEIYLTIRCSI